MAKRFPDDVGPVLRRRREARGLTQTALAAQSGIRLATISAVENGSNPRLETLVDFARALGYDTLTAAILDAGGDALTKRMLKVWRALEDDDVRREVLELMRSQIGAERGPLEPSAEGRASADEATTPRTPRRTRR